MRSSSVSSKLLALCCATLPIITAAPTLLSARDATNLTTNLHEIHTQAEAVTSAYASFTRGYLSFIPVNKTNTALIASLNRTISDLQQSTSADHWTLSDDEATNVLAYLNNQIYPAMEDGQSKSYFNMANLSEDHRIPVLRSYIRQLRPLFQQLHVWVEFIIPPAAHPEFAVAFKKIDSVFEMYGRQLFGCGDAEPECHDAA